MEKKAEVGVYPVEGSALQEMEEEDIREGLCSTQSSTVHFFFVLHIHTSYPSAESQGCGLWFAKLNSKLNRYRNFALFCEGLVQILATLKILHYYCKVSQMRSKVEA